MNSDKQIRFVVDPLSLAGAARASVHFITVGTQHQGFRYRNFKFIGGYREIRYIENVGPNLKKFKLSLFFLEFDLKLFLSYIKHHLFTDKQEYNTMRA